MARGTTIWASIPSLHQGLSHSNICEMDTIETEQMGKALLFGSDVQFGMARTTHRKTERALDPDLLGGFYIEDRSSPTKSSESSQLGERLLKSAAGQTE